MVEVEDIKGELVGKPVLDTASPDVCTASARLVGRSRDAQPVHRGTRRWTGVSPWELHRTADELVVLLEGGPIALTVLDADGPSTVVLTAGSLVVVPPGCWHRQTVEGAPAAAPPRHCGQGSRCRPPAELGRARSGRAPSRRLGSRESRARGERPPPRPRRPVRGTGGRPVTAARSPAGSGSGGSSAPCTPGRSPGSKARLCPAEHRRSRPPGAPRGIRTPNLRIKSPLLCR